MPEVRLPQISDYLQCQVKQPTIFLEFVLLENRFRVSHATAQGEVSPRTEWHDKLTQLARGIGEYRFSVDTL